MKQLILPVALAISLSACSYNPVIDTAGRSGTFPTAKAVEITNDIQHCKTLANSNTNTVIDSIQQASNWYASTATLGIIPKRTSDYETVVKNCLNNRGHSVVK